MGPTGPTFGLFRREQRHTRPWGGGGGIRTGRIYVSDSESDDFQNPGFEMGIRVGERETGWVTAFILYPWGDPRDPGGGTGAEFVTVDGERNIYGGEPRPRRIQKYVRVRP